jgi:hypothetical protein
MASIGKRCAYCQGAILHDLTLLLFAFRWFMVSAVLFVEMIWATFGIYYLLGVSGYPVREGVVERYSRDS